MTAEKRKWVRFGLALLAILLGGRCFFTVDETEWALVVRFGRVVRVVKEAGLHFRLPMDSVRKFDKRLQIYNPPATEFLTGDKKNLVLDVFVVWRVADPLRFLQSVKDTVWERCRVTAMRLYGIELVDVRLKRLLFPEQNREAVFARMRAERERIAQRYLAEGEEIATRIKAEADREKERILAEAYRQAERLRGEGDALAARIYGQAFSRDPEFYKMLRTLEAYKKALDNQTTVVLSSDSQFLRLLTQGKEGKTGR